MARRHGLVVLCVLGGLAGCGDNRHAPPNELVAKLTVEVVASVSADDALDAGIAGLGDHSFALVRADRRGGAFCPECIGVEPAACPAICRRAVIDVTLHRTTGAPDLPVRVAEVLPRSDLHTVDAVEIVALDQARVGVAWLECDLAACGPGLPRRSCTARYAAVDLQAMRVGDLRTLYEDRFGELQLSFDPRSRRLLALVGRQAPSSVGLRAAIYDETAANLMVPWRTFGGASAAAPAVAATSSGFIIVADDPAPTKQPPADPCAESCDCATAAAPELGPGGLYAFRTALGKQPERIAPGRGLDGLYAAREAIAVIEAGARVVVAATQAADRSAELFVSDVDSWVRRHASQAPGAPGTPWLGALGDGEHLAWLGADGDGLVAGVTEGEDEERGPLTEDGDGNVIEAGPVPTGIGVRTTFLLRAVTAPPDPAWVRFDVLAVRANW